MPPRDFAFWAKSPRGAIKAINVSAKYNPYVLNFMSLPFTFRGREWLSRKKLSYKDKSLVSKKENITKCMHHVDHSSRLGKEFRSGSRTLHE